VSMEICLDAQMLNTGLGFALESGDRPVLCMVAPNTLRLVVVHDANLVVSWELSLQLEAPSQAFVIPVHIAKILTGEVLSDMDTLRLMTEGQGVSLQLTGGDTPTELSWQWTPDVLSAPNELKRMLVLPQNPIEVRLEDLAAVVRLVQSQVQPPEQTQDVRRSLVPVMSVTRAMNLGGQNLGGAHSPLSYFDPRSLARAVELVASDNPILMEVTDAGGQTVFLTIVGERQDWRVLCALKAAVVERGTDMLVPRPASTGTRLLSPAALAEASDAPPAAPESPPAADAEPLTGRARPEVSAFVSEEASASDQDKPPDSARAQALEQVAAFQDTVPPDTEALEPDFLADLQADEDQQHPGEKRGRSNRRSPHFDVPLD
jgi:hypothetical protein